ncbi:aminodeoxychorismate lyase [Neptunicella sp. SCSIO 80796]|uniref:aminodeoxychorismate lyase n=1 Tax=Neptunicella plasticusilytica TaxID=3117012 RepID=UPI003A4E054B
MIVNGTASSLVPLDDRAVQYGDGCFTTMAVSNGLVEFWLQHLQRLQQSCSALQIEFNQWQELQQQVECIGQQHPDSVIKIIISRGSGGRGYAASLQQLPRYIITRHSKPAHYTDWQQRGIRLGLSPVTLACQPKLAGIKHLNRLEQVLIKQNTTDNQFDDQLVCDNDGMMVETGAANLFWKQQGIWFTPELTQSGVTGVMRNRVIDKMHEQGIAVQEIRARHQLLSQASEVFICNSLMKIVPVTHFNQHTFVIDDVRTFQRWFSL